MVRESATGLLNVKTVLNKRKDDGVVSSMLDNTDVTGDNFKPPLPDAGKKGKTKKKKIADNW